MLIETFEFNREQLMNRRQFVAAIGLGSFLRQPAIAVEPNTQQKPFTSGPETGKEVPSFFVRAITGPQMNRSVCFVCRNGDRPVVMLLLRRLESGTSAVLKAVDELVDRRRADGLRAFGVMLSDEPSKISPHLQTVSFDHQLNLPLGVGPEALGERDSLSIDPAASVTLIAYRDKKVVWTSAFRSAELRDELTRTRRLREILEQTESLLTTTK